MLRLSYYLLGLPFLTEQVLAQHIGVGGATYVAGQLENVAQGGFGDIVARVATEAMWFMNFAAILSIVIAGMLAIIAQDENRIATARKVLVMASIGIVRVNVAFSIMTGYTIAFNFDEFADPITGAGFIEAELLGFINFIEVPVAIIAIITIISYGIKAMVDYGGEQGAQSFKKAVLSVLTGILMITIKFIVAGAITTGDPTGIWDPAVRVLFYIVGYVALIAVVVIAIAGIYLIVNLADESRAEKAKKIIISVLFGLIFMLVIAALLAILIDGVIGTP